MRVTAESTERIVHLNRVPARIWEAVTPSGVKCFLFVTRIAVAKGQDTSRFDRELSEQRPPSAEAVEAFPLRMVL